MKMEIGYLRLHSSTTDLWISILSLVIDGTFHWNLFNKLAYKQ
jgi:hypothetical protein